MRRYGLRDDQWDRIQNMLPGRPGTVGVTASDNRLFVEAVLYRYRAGIPGGICRSASVTGRTFIAASAAGRKLVSGKGFSASGRRCRYEYAMIDSTIVRAHQHQCRRQKKAGVDQAIGRSRGGLSTKIHTLVDALGNPVRFHLTGGEHMT